MANSANLCRSQEWNCGCQCDSCHPDRNSSLHLHKEIEELKHQLLQRDYYILQMETSVFMAADKYPKGEYVAIREELAHWQEKYERLLESHKKLQKVNQGLEDKLLKIVDKYETEKGALNRDVSNLTSRLVDARIMITDLEEENEQYRNDCSVAVQLLQCKPSNFVSHRLETLPMDLQQKVRGHLGLKRHDSTSNGSGAVTNPDFKVIRVPIPTFPPTAMVYSVSKAGESSLEDQSSLAPVHQTPVDVVSAAIMAKVLEERAKERNFQRTPLTRTWSCRCESSRWATVDTEEKGVQTQWTMPPEACARMSGDACNGMGTSYQKKAPDSNRAPSSQRFSGSSSSTETEI